MTLKNYLSARKVFASLQRQIDVELFYLQGKNLKNDSATIITWMTYYHKREQLSRNVMTSQVIQDFKSYFQY